MSNQAAMVAAAEQKDHFLAPLMVQVVTALREHGLEPPLMVQVEVTPPDDSAFRMALLMEKGSVRFLPQVAEPSSYVRADE